MPSKFSGKKGSFNGVIFCTNNSARTKRASTKEVSMIGVTSGEKLYHKNSNNRESGVFMDNPFVDTSFGPTREIHISYNYFEKGSCLVIFYCQYFEPESIL